MVKTNWIGKPLGKNKPHNFFKTSKANYPVSMFGDADKDGVANIFDCKPYDPSKQGLIDAIVGAVKGFTSGTGVRKGWSEGMKTPSYASRFKAYGLRMKPAPREKIREMSKVIRQSNEAIEQQAAQKKQTAEEMQTYKDFRKAYFASKHPTLAAAGEYAKKLPGAKLLYPEAKVKGFKQVPTKWKLNAKGEKVPIAWKRVQVTYYKPETQYQAFARRMGGIEMMRRKVQSGNISPIQRRQIMAVKRSARMLFPVLPASTATATYQYQSKKGQQSGRGRPRGSLDPRYAAYGGVYGYRRAMAQKRRELRQQIQMQEEMIRQQRMMQRLRPQEQLPEEVLPEMQVQQQLPQPQMPQQVQPVYQMPQTQEQRPIATVFKSSGGSPYPPVDRRPLTPSRQTIQQGYIETTDAFTGERIIKRLPPPERWAAGG